MNTKNTFDDNDLALLQKSLELLPNPFEPLDVSALDGFLVGVLLQPSPIALADWWREVVDPEHKVSAALLKCEPALQVQALVQKRHAELNQAISQRQWFDPWVFELDDAEAQVSDSAMPWVAGFALAMDLYPGLMAMDASETLEPLALIYANFDPDDLEDADELLEAIADIEPASSLVEAVEDMVSASLTRADVSRPLPAGSPGASKRDSTGSGAKRAAGGKRRSGPR